MSIRFTFLAAAVLPAWAAAAELMPASVLAKAAPAASLQVIELALTATECAMQRGEPAPQRLAIIDYTRASTEPRLWVFDLVDGSLIYKELVAHGRNSGGNYAHKFSNTPDSLASSLGLFRTLDTYTGRNGYSLRMEGLEPDVNDRALARHVVIHGADYVDAQVAEAQGRIGRSWGCPAVRRTIAERLIDDLKNGQLVFSYYPDSHWLASSSYLNCGGTEVVDAGAAPPEMPLR